VWSGSGSATLASLSLSLSLGEWLKVGHFLLPLDRPEEAYSAAEPVAEAAVGGEGASLVLSFFAVANVAVYHVFM